MTRPQILARELPHPSELDEWDELDSEARARQLEEYYVRIDGCLRDEIEVAKIQAKKEFMQEVGTPAAEDRLDDDVVVLTHFKPPPGCKPFARLADEGERWDRNEQKILDLKVDFFIETINRFENGTDSAKRTVIYNWMEETLRGGSAYQLLFPCQRKDTWHGSTTQSRSGPEITRLLL